jgi:lipopolysaccharide export system protein LptC
LRASVTTIVSADKAIRATRYRAARRHSVLVRALRVLLPAGAAGALMLFVASSFIGSGGDEPEIGTVSLQGTTLVMNRPRLTGYDQERRPFELTAAAARQAIADPRRIVLDRVQARTELAANGWARVTADEGLYDSEREVVTGTGNVHVTSSFGYEVLMERATTFLRENRLVTDKAVELRYGENRLFAEKMTATEGGAVVVFEGRVRLIWHEREEDQ